MAVLPVFRGLSLTLGDGVTRRRCSPVTPAVFRDPRWGRGQETPGEDPVLNGVYGAMFVSGFQGDASEPANGSAPEPSLRKMKSSACAKHFFGYSLENCFHPNDNCRFNFNANLTQQEIEDTYLPAFQATVEVGRVSGLMCSENAVNGVPTCANSWAMTTVARNSWGFDGESNLLGLVPSRDALAEVFTFATQVTSQETAEPSRLPSVSERFRLIPLQNCLFTSELKWQSRGK